jgi:flagellar biosynthetic protein FlhB
LFAAEDEGKTEQPTQRRLREARRQGRVPKTPELAAALTLLTGAIYLAANGKKIYGELQVLMMRLFEAAGQPSFELTSLGSVVGMSGLVLIRTVLPLLVIVFVVAALAEILQVGVHWSAEPLKPSFEKISFTWEKLKKKVLLSRPVAIGLLKSFLKLVIISLITFLTIKSGLGKLMGLIDVTPARSVVFLSLTALKLIVWVAILFIVLSIMDFFYQRFEFMESQKITRGELKRELIEDEGNPIYKRRIMEMYQQNMQRRKMLAEVPKADVVVTNPTHYAVALQYEEGRMEAPKVLAKGDDLLALRIKEIAREHKIPMKEDRGLARALFEQAEIGKTIPYSLYQAVAAVFSYVYELKSKKAS